MKTIDVTRRAARSLRNAKARTILTSLAIAVGAFTITVSLAAGEGARAYADKLISSNVNSQALFIVKDKTIFEGSTQRAPISEYDSNTTSRNGVAVKQLAQSDIEKLEARDDITSIVPIYNPSVEYIQFKGNATKYVAGVSAYDPSILSEVSSGSLPQLGTQINDTEAIVPGSFVSTLVDKGIIKNENDLIGRTITATVVKATASPTADQISAAFVSGGEAALQTLVKPETKEFSFTVVGVTKKAATALTSSSDIQISANSARAINEYTTQGTDRYQKYFGATAIVKDGVDPEAVKQSIKNDEYYAQTAKDLQGVIFTVVNTLQGIVLGFGVVALIASVFGIINTQYISVLERTREIGLMKALGMRGRSVSRLFQFEAAWIGFLGGVIGALFAVILGTALNPWITDVLSLGEGNFILIFQTIPIILMIIALMLIAMLAGWFPARKAAKLDPIEALRTE